MRKRTDVLSRIEGNIHHRPMISEAQYIASRLMPERREPPPRKSVTIRKFSWENHDGLPAYR